jgi:iron complex transport system permease protein
VHPFLSPKTLLTRVAAAILLLVLVMVACSFVGTEPISLKAALAGPALSSASPNPDYEILLRVRVPRILLAAIVGAALAGAGVVFQAILRNPLADPYILGVSSGAGLGAMLAVICSVNWTLWGRSPVAVFAFFGALGTVWLVWTIGRITGKFHVTGLLLAGVVVNACFSAVIMFLTSITRSQDVYATVFWLMGNLAEEEAFVLWASGGCVVAGIVALLFLGAQLNVISFGPTDARSMGIHVERVQFVALAISAFITAVAVSLSGLIGFVGLIVPHAVRLVLGPDHRQLLPLSCVAGAIFLIVADTVARWIVAPAQLPVGVITAMAGGPFFLILLIRYNRKVYWLS